MKTTALAVATAAALFSVPALAQHAGYAVQQDQQYQQPQHQAYAPQPPPGHPDDSCDHDRDHRGFEHQAWVARRGGHYELQAVQKWTEGYYQSVWVAGDCVGRHFVKVCSPGYYRQDWVPGRYVTEQQWVWVDRHDRHDRRDRRDRHGHGRFWGRR
jgi:hypothetical protein